MTSNELKDRLKQFALQVVLLAEQLPAFGVYRTIHNQIMRCAPSSAANYRASCRGKSKRDFIAKLGIVEEELDETLFWLEFLVARDEAWRPRIAALWKEGDELLAIIVASIKTARANEKAPGRNKQ